MQARLRSLVPGQVLIGGIALCVTLVAGGLWWRRFLTATGMASGLTLRELAEFLPTTQHPAVEVLKLLAALLIGILVTAVLRHSRHQKQVSPSMEQTQVLLCVSGALMMIIIGNSLARAFGVAGAASIIRFRTPVEDPKDTISLFLLLGLGMACGLGAFGLAGLGTAFLCVALLLLDLMVDKPPRSLMLTLAADGPSFPAAHVQGVFARLGIESEARRSEHGDETSLRYRILMAPNISLEQLTEELTAGGAAGIKSVTWEDPKEDKKKRKKESAGG